MKKVRSLVTCYVGHSTFTDLKIGEVYDVLKEDDRFYYLKNDTDFWCKGKFEVVEETSNLNQNQINNDPYRLYDKKLLSKSEAFAQSLTAAQRAMFSELMKLPNDHTFKPILNYGLNK